MVDTKLKELQDKQPKQTAEVGKCGKCGSDDVHYGHSEFADGDSLYYEMDCGDCGASMHEWYELKFVGTDVMIEDDEGGQIEYLNEGDVILDERGEE